MHPTRGGATREGDVLAKGWWPQGGYFDGRPPLITQLSLPLYAAAERKTEGLRCAKNDIKTEAHGGRAPLFPPTRFAIMLST